MTALAVSAFCLVTCLLCAFCPHWHFSILFASFFVCRAGYSSQVVPVEKLAEATQAIVWPVAAGKQTLCLDVFYQIHASLLELQAGVREGWSKGWRGVQWWHFSVQQHRS